MASVRARAALTLLELLVVLGIMTLTIGLAIPAVQKVRQTSARIRCVNNLRQIAVASQLYHDTHGSLPPGVFDWEKPTGRPPQSYYPFWSWMAALLPYVEQGPLFAQADRWARQNPNPTKPLTWWPWGDFENGFATAQPNPALGTLVSTWTCPSDPRTLVAVNLEFGPNARTNVALTAYLGVSGLESGDGIGVLFYKSKVRLGDIKDGTSRTLLVGERPPSRDLYYGWWFAGAGFDGMGTGDVVLGGRELDYVSCLKCQPEANWVGFRGGRVSESCDQAHFWSLHSGGANFALADGSVRFWTVAVSPAVFDASCTRNGGEVLDPP